MIEEKFAKYVQKVFQASILCPGPDNGILSVWCNFE